MRPIRRFLSALLGATVLALALFGAAGPAAAHDAAESSSPAAGATLAAPPEQVSVTFTNNPLAIGSQFLVTDAAGTNWADGGVQIVDNVASQKLRSGAPAGPYTVAWRVASSDGHPIEGSFTFTVTAGPGAAGSPGAAVPTMGTAAPGTIPAPEPAPSAAEPFPWSLVIFVGTALGILVALALMARRRLTPDRDQPEGQ
jgi:methionine-rich copper-binding protein CopC